MAKQIPWRTVLKNLFVILALSINYTCGYILTFILKLEIGYALVIALVSSFLASFLLRNMIRSFISVCLSIFLSIWITIVLLSAPWLVAYGVFVMGPYLEMVLRPLILIFFMSFFGALVGSLIVDYFSL